MRGTKGNFRWLLLSSLGVTLLVCGLVLTPTSTTVGQDTLRTQCPNKFDSQGNFLGCENPGQQCDYAGRPGICGLSENKSNCTCLPVSGS